jgi:hypothetical protein
MDEVKRWVAPVVLSILLFWAGFLVCGWALGILFPPAVKHHYNVTWVK